MTLKNLDHETFEKLAGRFRALSEVSRLRIVEALQRGEMSVSELVVKTGLNQPNVSRHLQVLHQVGLIGRRKDGTTTLYRIVDNTLSQVCGLVCGSVRKK